MPRWAVLLYVAGIFFACWLTQQMVEARVQETGVSWGRWIDLRFEPSEFDSLGVGETWSVRVEASRPDSLGPVYLTFHPIRPTYYTR